MNRRAPHRPLMFIALLLALFVSQPASAQGVDTCSALAEAVESNLMAAALQDSLGASDGSGVRGAVSQGKITNLLLLAQGNLQLMAQNRCPPREKPLSYVAYMRDAARCAFSVGQRQANSPACDTKTWRSDDGDTSTK